MKWIKKDNIFKASERKSKPNLSRQRENLLLMLFEIRTTNIDINSYVLFEKIFQADLINKSFDAILHLLYRNLKNNNISLRKGIHIGQPLPMKLSKLKKP